MKHDKRSTDKPHAALKRYALKALYLCVIAASLTVSYLMFTWDSSVLGGLLGILCVVPAWMALVELFPAKWEGEE